MKSLLVVPATVSLLVAGVAMAQNPDPDEICIVFDYDSGCVNSCISPDIGLFSAYVVLQNASEPSGVSGYEFCLCNEDGSIFNPPAGFYFPTAYVLPPGSVNVDVPPCFVVGIASPLPWQPCILLVEIQILSVTPPGTVPWCFGVEPYTYSSIPDHMVYAAGNNPGLLLPMYPCTGPDEPSCLMACVNSPDCPPPIPLEETSWSQIKGFYK